MKYIYISARKDSNRRYRKYRLYHISPITDPPITEMIPRIPNNDMTKGGFEESKTPRISFSPSIGKCLAALARDITGKKFRVYALDYIPKGRKSTPSEVEDVKLTDEYWVMEPVYPIYLGIVQADSKKPRAFKKELREMKEEDYIAKYYPDNPAKGKRLHNMYSGNKLKHRTFETKSMGKDKAYLDDWTWKWVEREKD